jgi:hypothetical protein
LLMDTCLAEVLCTPAARTARTTVVAVPIFWPAKTTRPTPLAPFYLQRWSSTIKSTSHVRMWLIFCAPNCTYNKSSSALTALFASITGNYHRRCAVSGCAAGCGFQFLR